MSRLSSRDGFTLVEIIVVLVVAALLGAIGWSLAMVGADAHSRELRRADSERTRQNVEAVIGGALQRTARGGVSAPNLGMVRVGIATSGSQPRDTLVLLHAEGPAITVASRACTGAGATLCIVLQGEHAGTLSAGELIAVGSQKAGYRLLQVTGTGTTYSADCGTDCPVEAFCPVAIHSATTVIEVVAATATNAAGTTVGGGSACLESYRADGSRCRETRVLRTTEPRLLSQCSAAQGLQARYTNIMAVDRTGTGGFPSPYEWSSLSGGSAPAIAAVPVALSRVYPVPDRGELALYMQAGLTAAGAWQPARRVAGPIQGFRVEALHEGATAWTRGDGVDRPSLFASTNRTYHVVPAHGASGIEYARGYHSLVALRVRTEAVGQGSDGTRTVHPIWTVQSLAPLARGGARDKS